MHVLGFATWDGDYAPERIKPGKGELDRELTWMSGRSEPDARGARPATAQSLGLTDVIRACLRKISFRTVWL